MVNEIEFIKNMQKLELKDGDLIVLRIGRCLSIHERKALKDTINLVSESVGFKNKTLLLEDGIEIGILRKADE